MVDVDVLDEVVLLVEVVVGIGDVLVLVDDDVVLDELVELDVDEVVDEEVVVGTGLHSAGSGPASLSRTIGVCRADERLAGSSDLPRTGR